MKYKLGSSSAEFRSFDGKNYVVEELREFFFTTPPVHSGGLYHYTHLEAAKKILGDSVLLLSSSRNLNDMQEPQDKDLYVFSFSFGAIENVAMWGIYSRPLVSAVRLKFRQSEIRALAGKCNKFLYPVMCRNVCDREEYKVLVECEDSVELKRMPLLTDVLYVDNFRDEKSGHVALRWNNNSIHVPLYVLKSLQAEDFRFIMKYSGWAYERESRLSVKVSFVEDKIEHAIRGYSKEGWQFSKNKVALCLGKGVVNSINVRGGPCLPTDDLKSLDRIGSLQSITSSGSLLHDCIRGGVFCSGCNKREKCRNFN